MEYLIQALFSKGTWQEVGFWWDLIETLVIIIATLFTAVWAYRTFGHKEKVESLKKLQKCLEKHQKHLVAYCSWVEVKKDPYMNEGQESVDTINKFISEAIQGIFHNQFEMERMLRDDLDLRENFRREFSDIARPLFNNDILKTQNIREKSEIYDKLRSSIHNESALT